MKVEHSPQINDQEQRGAPVKEESCAELAPTNIKTEPVDPVDVVEIKVECDNQDCETNAASTAPCPSGPPDRGEDDASPVTYLGLEASVFARQAKGVDKVYRCPGCSYSTKVRPLLLRHARAMHDPGADVLRCAFCPYTTKWKGNLVAHARSKHLSEGEEGHACPHCPYRNKWKSRVLRHVREKHQAALLKCSKCEYRTARAGALCHHARTKHGDQLEHHACLQCEYAGRTAYELTVHIKTKHEVEWHVCKQCTFRTKWRSNLGTHVRNKHSGQPQRRKKKPASEAKYELQVPDSPEQHL